MKSENDQQGNPKRNIVIGIIVPLLVFLGSRQSNNKSISPTGTLYESADVQITEIFLCEGLDENGQPINRFSRGNSDAWVKIHVCAFVSTIEPATLNADWYFQEINAPFAWGDVKETVFHDRYIAFSLEESVNTTKEVPWEKKYLGEEILAGYLPEGEYQIKIYQARNELISFSFQVQQ